MIDERHEELAALYALDLLEDGELAQFESDLARDPALQALVRELRDASSELAHATSAPPAPTRLKARVLASIRARGAAAAPPNNVVPTTAATFRAALPWAAAAGLALAAAWWGQLYRASRTEADLLRAQQELADVALKTTRNQLEAEQLLNSRQVVDLNQEIANQIRRVAEAEKSFADARNQITALNLKLKSQADLADLKIATLASMLNNSPEALAVAVWNPAKQEGILNVEKLPALAAGQTYELWVIEDRKPPVSAGVFLLGGDGRGRVRFKPTAPVALPAVFAVSREKDDGVRAHASPGEVLVLGKTQ